MTLLLLAVIAMLAGGIWHFGRYPSRRETWRYALSPAHSEDRQQLNRARQQKQQVVKEASRALRYEVAVGRESFAWRGTERISRKAKWPDWHPPASMRQRQPELPQFVPGGPDNPLGARALYLGETLYRIHGTNDQESIGQAVSVGCIRMRNSDVKDLYERVTVGAAVVVL
jgi:lipoprotein-anchoring transpeptidase ErfK/SrfK